MGFLQNLTKPSISFDVPDQPREGGEVTSYEVMGMWQPDGSVIVPDRIVVNTESGQTCEKPGDVISLSRLEAAILGKTVCLAPVITPKDAV